MENNEKQINNYNQLTILLIVSLLIVNWAFPASALSGDNYKIPNLVMTAGGATEMSSAAYKLMDSKGFYGGSILKAGPNYVLVVPIEEVVVPPVDPAPEGTVTLTIAREGDVPGSNVLITWQGNTPDIYYLVGDGEGRYTNDIDGWVDDEGGVRYIWTKVLDGNTGALEEANFEVDLGARALKHLDQVGESDQEPEVYYKGFVAEIDPADNHPDGGGTYLAKAPAVGKVNVVLPRNSFKLINVPFVMADAKVSEMIGNQLAAAKLQFNENGLKQIVLGGGGWDSDIDLQSYTGYWLKATDQDRVCTFYGRVLRENFSRLVPQGWGLYGYPLPQKANAAMLSGALPPVEGDKLQTLRSGALVQFYHGGVNWDDPTFEIQGREGFWYWNPQPAPERNMEVAP